MNRLRVIGVVLLLALLPACTDSRLEKAAKGLLLTSKLVAELQTTVIQAEEQNLVSEETAADVMRLCVRINQAGEFASSILKTLEKLDEPSAEAIIAALRPVTASVGDAVNSGLLGVKNEATRDKVRLALLAIQSGLNSVALALAIGG